MMTATRASGAWQTAFPRSIEDPEAFWSEAGAAIHWYKKWDKVLDDSRAPFYRWFTGGQLNTCFNALDWHVETGRADQTALIYDSPISNQIKTFTYRELRDATSRFAGVLAQLGVGKGDRVVIYMPMVPEAVVAMLACARIGAVHSVVFGGFASRELAIRIDNGRHAVALKWTMKNIYGSHPGDVFWAASDVGWVVGHSYLVYGPLLHGNTTVLYEGKPVGTPDAGAFWRVISQHKVKTLFTAPTAFRTIKIEDHSLELKKK